METLGARVMRKTLATPEIALDIQVRFTDGGTMTATWPVHSETVVLWVELDASANPVDIWDSDGHRLTSAWLALTCIVYRTDVMLRPATRYGLYFLLRNGVIDEVEEFDDLDEALGFATRATGIDPTLWRSTSTEVPDGEDLESRFVTLSEVATG